MAQLLSEPVVLQYILETPGGRTSLARLARTCKTVTDPALDVLWKNIDGLTPLLRLIPAHLIKVTRRLRGFKALNNRPILDDWSSFLSYASRIRYLSFNDVIQPVDHTVFAVLEQHKPQAFLTPRLVNLRWEVDNPETLSRCALFFPPNTIESVSVDIGTMFPAQTIERFFGLVARSTSRLLKLSITSATAIPMSVFSDTLSGLRALEHVSLSAPNIIQPTTGRWLLGLSRLSSLELNLSGKLREEVELFLPGDEYTPSIRKLRLTGTGSLIAVLVRRMRCDDLRHLELVLDDVSAELEWREVLFALQIRTRGSLRFLRIDASKKVRKETALRTTVPLAALGPLPFLKHLEMHLPGAVIRDDDLQFLSSACPALEIARLCSESCFDPSVESPKVSLNGLLELCTGCPRLHTLAVVLHADGSTFIPSSESFNQTGLRRLTLGASWIEDPIFCAMLLSDFFPVLESLVWSTDPHGQDGSGPGWRQVYELLPVLRQVRLEERRRAIRQVEIVNSLPDIPQPPYAAEVVSQPSTPIKYKEQSVDTSSLSVKQEAEVQVAPIMESRGMIAHPAVAEKSVQSTEISTAPARSYRSCAIQAQVETKSSLVGPSLHDRSPQRSEPGSPTNSESSTLAGEFDGTDIKLKDSPSASVAPLNSAGYERTTGISFPGNQSVARAIVNGLKPESGYQGPSSTLQLRSKTHGPGVERLCRLAQHVTFMIAATFAEDLQALADMDIPVLCYNF